MFSMTFSNCQHNIPDREGLRAVSSRQLVRQQKTPDGLSGERWSGTESWWLLAERRRCRKTTSETGEEWSVRYRGAWMWWHQYISIPSLYFTRSGTSNQSGSLCMRSVRPWSYFCAPLTMRAATFSTRCSLSVTFFGAPMKIALQ